MIENNPIIMIKSNIDHSKTHKKFIIKKHIIRLTFIVAQCYLSHI